MAYASWSVVFGEQPTASKWNILGTNDASFNDGTGIAGLYKNLLTTDSNPYKFLAYRNAAANTGNNAYAVVACDTEVYDTNSNHSAGVYTAPVTGFYHFYGQINVSIGGSNATTIVALYKNASIALQGGAMKVLASTSVGLVVSGVISLAATDTVDMRAYAETTSALGVGTASQNYFGGYLVSRT